MTDHTELTAELAISEFVEDYEFGDGDGETGYYQPTESDKIMLIDFAHGLIDMLEQRAKATVGAGGAVAHGKCGCYCPDCFHGNHTLCKWAFCTQKPATPSTAQEAMPDIVEIAHFMESLAAAMDESDATKYLFMQEICGLQNRAAALRAHCLALKG